MKAIAFITKNKPKIGEVCKGVTCRGKELYNVSTASVKNIEVAVNLKVEGAICYIVDDANDKQYLIICITVPTIMTSDRLKKAKKCTGFGLIPEKKKICPNIRFSPSNVKFLVTVWDSTYIYSVQTEKSNNYIVVSFM